MYSPTEIFTRTPHTGSANKNTTRRWCFYLLKRFGNSIIQLENNHLLADLQN